MIEGSSQKDCKHEGSNNPKAVILQEAWDRREGEREGPREGNKDGTRAEKKGGDSRETGSSLGREINMKNKG